MNHATANILDRIHGLVCELRMWSTFAACLVLICGSIIAIGMGWYGRYCKMRQQHNRDAVRAIEQRNHDAELQRSFVTLGVPDTIPVLNLLRSQVAARKQTLARMDGLAERITNVEAVEAKRAEIRQSITELNRYEADLRDASWHLASMRFRALEPLRLPGYLDK